MFERCAKAKKFGILDSFHKEPDSVDIRSGGDLPRRFSTSTPHMGNDLGFETPENVLSFACALTSKIGEKVAV